MSTSIGDQLNALLFDINKHKEEEEEEEEEEDKAKICDSYNEDIDLNDVPSLRDIVMKETDNDPKYGGQTVSRKQLEQEDIETSSEENEEYYDDDDDDDDEMEEDIIEDDKEGEENDDQDTSSEISSEIESEAEEQKEEIEREDKLDGIPNAKEDIDLFKNDTNDIEKGTAVKHQLGLWDGLLECRIKLQKCLSLSNQLPQTDIALQFLNNGGSMATSNKEQCESVLYNLMDKLTSLQRNLIEKSTNIDKEEAEEEEKGENDSYENILQTSYESLNTFRDDTLEKWSNKLQLATGKLTMKSYAQRQRSILTNLQQSLADKPKLRKRTQLKRSINRILGKKLGPANDENGEELSNAHLFDYDEEIFNDEDFYHQLLKELIQSKTSDVNTDDHIKTGRKWLELQSLRTKVKKKVDTKASKGRRLRYHCHQKLVGFMAPVNNCTYPESARYNLFTSLFDSRQQ